MYHRQSRWLVRGAAQSGLPWFQSVRAKYALSPVGSSFVLARRACQKLAGGGAKRNPRNPVPQTPRPGGAEEAEGANGGWWVGEPGRDSLVDSNEPPNTKLLHKSNFDSLPGRAGGFPIGH